MLLVTFTRERPGAKAELAIGALLDQGSAVLELGRVTHNDDLLAFFDLDGPRIGHAGGLIAKRPAAAVVSREDVRLRAPVPRPGKLVCIGLKRNAAAMMLKISKKKKQAFPALCSTSDKARKRIRALNTGHL